MSKVSDGQLEAAPELDSVLFDSGEPPHDLGATVAEQPAPILPIDWDARFRSRFVKRMRCTLQAIADYIVKPSPATRAAMADTVHKLTGIAGALGRTEVSDHARQLDIALCADAPPPAAVVASVVEVLATELDIDRSR